jgi:sugar lactone lactonase YvrE
MIATVALDVGAYHAEGCVWDSVRNRLLFVDLYAGRVLDHDPESGDVVVHELGGQATDVHPTTRPDRVLVAVRDGIALVDASGAVTPLARPLHDRPELRMNDGHVAPDGRYFAGSMADDVTPGVGELFCLDPGTGELSVVFAGVTISNGIDWSPDGATAYYVDSPTGRIDACDYDAGAPAGLAQRRPFARIDPDLGMPDGLTVDAEGGVWVAVFGGGQVQHFTPSGELDAVVEVPGAPLVTACCLGGRDLDQLFIATSQENLDADALAAQPDAGRIFAVAPGVTGKPATPFPC